MILCVSLTEVGLDHAPILEDLFRWPFGERATEVQDDRPATNADDDLHDMLDQDDGDAVFADAADHAERLLDLDVVETGHHLIEEEQLGPHRQGPRELQPFAVGNGQTEHRVLALFYQANQLQHLVGGLHRRRWL